MPLATETNIQTALRRYWGYDSFRPLQEKIVQSLLDRRDTCVIMPTGGGKSLCYQLPAAMLDGQTVIVISPLIALMQDQVAQLTQMGISAALLNTSITSSEQSLVMRKAREGAYRLLYLSPERLARADTITWLQSVPISLFAIAFRSGGMSFALNIGSSVHCANIFLMHLSQHSRPVLRSVYGTIFSINCVCAILINTSPASIGRTCATSQGSVRAQLPNRPCCCGLWDNTSTAM
jgi:hypothetical protein